RSPRGGVELNQFTAMLEAIRDINLSESIDGWKWALDSKGFTVSSARKFIDEQTLIGTDKAKIQENGQNRTNTGTGMEEHAKSREKAIKSQKWSTQVNLWST
ncbi:hypothetical protein Tco_0143932, partial [Tanacetum coccineum]